VNRACALFDLRKRFFLDRGNDHLDTLAPGSFEDKKRESSVAGNQSKSTL
jgi:hypothetical protein